EASFGEGVILETLVLSVLNYDSSVAGAAARMVSAAGGRPLAEMGSRRTGERSAVAAARAAYIAGFAATSNLEAGRSWGVPTMGTAAHAFTLLHDSEEDAFRSQIDAMGPGTTLLIDTYDVEQATELAVEVAGPGLGAVRLDSGDLPALVASVRKHLDSLGNQDTKITVTNDLDEYTIAALAATPVDSYGVGTSVVTGSGSVAAGMVYKLVAHRGDDGDWVSVAKRSAKKSTVGGRKNAVRRLDGSGTANAEVLYVEGLAGTTPPTGASAGGSERPLLVDLVVDGVAIDDHCGALGVTHARQHHREVLREMPAGAFRLSRGGEAIIPTEYADGE
ncbi:MAG: nicotinate phosphoribosyltransferase, partial [Subtercola sp.]|nr:nicotinate phosphoribosyltransferase [Subtercola sp.]